MYKRKIENDLINYYNDKTNPKILVVYGARQIGKKLYYKKHSEQSV